MIQKIKLQILLLLLIISFDEVSASAEKQFVKLPEYSAFGFQDTTKNGISANIFLGLPYAKPPINELRFEKPEPLSLTPTKVLNATQWPSPCHQGTDISASGYNTSEDCLYFNVFTPAKLSTKLLPVFIFIHGGGFSYGKTQTYGYEYFVDNFISQDIIMVNFQYRLAHFGFFATPDHVINGNFGHFDQIQALEFLNKNIHAFGGDPKRITVIGHSAGSLSLHTLSLSPKTKDDLFQQEIHIAGSNYCQFAIDTEFVLKHSEVIGNAVGCNQSDTSEKKLCLKKVDYTKFWDVRKTLNLNSFPNNSKHFLYWSTVHDNDLFEGKEIDELQKVAEKKNILHGIDAGEGLLWTLHTENPGINVFSKTRGFKPEERSNATADSIKTFLRMIMSNTTVFSPQIQEEVINKVFSFYKIGDQHLAANNPLHFFEKYTEIYTDVVSKIPMTKEIEAKFEYGFKNQYIFQFSYVRPQDRAIIGNLPGHGYFLLYFGGIEIYTSSGITYSEEEKRVQKSFAEMLGNFVKTGEPSYNNLSIPKITKDKFAYMNLDEVVAIKDDEFTTKHKFWKELDRTYSHDIIRNIPLKKEDYDKSEL
uniref:Carboxylic ester hydrolase n=1 Tax=Panagrolaimus sp. ES5 TaxID=591445 RepID=A0AC34FSL3_9BILA